MHRFEMVYNDWIKSIQHDLGIDAWHTIEVMDMQGTWKDKSVRFEEADDYMSLKKSKYIADLLYKGQPVRHE